MVFALFRGAAVRSDSLRHQFYCANDVVPMNLRFLPRGNVRGAMIVRELGAAGTVVRYLGMPAEAMALVEASSGNIPAMAAAITRKGDLIPTLNLPLDGDERSEVENRPKAYANESPGDRARFGPRRTRTRD